MMARTYDLASEFSRFPFGRFPDHGPASGQRFRDEVLAPALRNGEELVVDLTGARGLGPSFLEEAFGGLVRAGFDANTIRSLLKVRSERDPSYESEVWSYVDDAQRVAAN